MIVEVMMETIAYWIILLTELFIYFAYHHRVVTTYRLNNLMFTENDNKKWESYELSQADAYYISDVIANLVFA